MPDCAGNLALVLESDLLQAGWDRSNDPADHVDSGYQVALRQQRASLLKKFVGELAEDEQGVPETAALSLFLSNNEACENWSFNAQEEDVRMVVGEAQSLLDRFFHPSTSLGPRTGELLTPFSILEGVGFGAGANVGHTNVDFYSKLSSSARTCTNTGLGDFLAHAFVHHPLWSSVFNTYSATGLGLTIVQGSTLAFAPKNAEIARVIAVEPLLNMFYQKGIQAALEKRLREVFGIDLSLQPDKNRELARLGSLYQAFCTIDLKSASDRNSIKMVEKLLVFARVSFSWLMRTRSPSIVLPGDKCVPLHMLSSMGNAFTFPLQTIIFASVVVASYKVLGITVQHPKGTALGNYGVFGDDIICVPESYDLVCRSLLSLGHIINHDKSFSKGLFRESCGSDWYAGRNVRGVYIKSLTDECDIYSAINRLNGWSAKHYVPLENTVNQLLGMLGDDIKLVPMHEQDTAGIRVPEDFVDPTRYRWHHGVKNGRSYRAVVPAVYRVDLTDEVALNRQIHAARRKLLQSRRKGSTVRLNAKEKYLALKARYDPSVHLLAVLSSKLRDRYFAIREFGRRTTTKGRRSSCWDYVPPERSERGDGGAALHLLTRINLGKLDPNLTV